MADIQSDYNIKTIRQVLSHNITEYSQISLTQVFNTLNKEIEKFLIEYEQFLMYFEEKKRLIQMNYVNIGQDETTSNYSMFKSLSNKHAYIEMLFKDGYQIIHRLRQWLTGDIIKYQIGTSYYGELYEGQFSLDEILKYAQIQYGGKNIFSLRLHMKKSTVADRAKQLENELENISEKGTTVFTEVFRHFYTDKSHPPTVNRGNAYQVYRSVIADRHNIINANKIPAEINTSPYQTLTEYLDNKLLSIRANNIAGYKGGDVLNQQDKFISSDPSLISIVSIQKVIREYNNAINDFIGNKSGQTLFNTMMSLFTKEDYRKGISQGIEIQALNFTVENLRKNIEKITGQTIVYRSK